MGGLNNKKGGNMFFENIKIYQSKGKDYKGKSYWSFGWKFEYKGEKYGSFIDNMIRTKEKLDYENQIAMLRMMILAMKKLAKAVTVKDIRKAARKSEKPIKGDIINLDTIRKGVKFLENRTKISLEEALGVKKTI